MGSREVPFFADERCDTCGKEGAFDFVGDLYCGECANGLVNHDGTPLTERDVAVAEAMIEEIEEFEAGGY